MILLSYTMGALYIRWQGVALGRDDAALTDDGLIARRVDQHVGIRGCGEELFNQIFFSLRAALNPLFV